jgi:uncharacterized membrane protein
MGEPAPPWARLGSLGLSVAGLGVSAYLAVDHFTSRPVLACPATAVVNCEKVTTSPQSVLLGIPVALYGLVFFVAMVALTLPYAWRDERLARARVGAAALGVVSVFYLVGVELFAVDAICLWCTAVHVITIVLFAILVFAMAVRQPVEAGRGNRR